MSFTVLILQLIIAVLALPVYILHFLGLWNSISKRMFPLLMSKLADKYNKAMETVKKDLFSNLCDFTGPSKELTLLEIGCGSGANFSFYPQGCRVTCIDLNPNFQPLLSKSIAQNDHIKFENFIVASADNMKDVPDASVDVVVCTLLVCSVPSTPKVLEEVLRVLRPGGAFYFIEHVASTDNSSWTPFIQKILDPIWKLLLDGCNLRRSTWIDLEKAKFSELKLRHLYANKLMYPVRPHVVGYAIK